MPRATVASRRTEDLPAPPATRSRKVEQQDLAQCVRRQSELLLVGNRQAIAFAEREGADRGGPAGDEQITVAAAFKRVAHGASFGESTSKNADILMNDDRALTAIPRRHEP